MDFHECLRKRLLELIVMLWLMNTMLFSLNCGAQNSEASALMDIKNAVGLGSPYLTSWSSSSASPCLEQWLGVTCNDANRVVQLNVSGFNLHGTLPDQVFGALTTLQSLDISNNLLMGPIPITLSQLTQLRALNMTSNAFKETFPEAILSLTNLVELHLDNNYFMGKVPNEISNLQSLEQLWMGNNSFVGPLPSTLSSLKHMSILTAWGNDLSMELPSDWGVWVNLTYLNLHNSFISGHLPEEWGALSKLERLRLYENSITGSIPDSWKDMMGLQELRLSYNELSGNAPNWIGQLPINSVDFQCNFLQGHPSSYNDSKWKGNCFNSDLKSHIQTCPDKITCEEFFSKNKNSLSKGTIIGIAFGCIVLLCGVVTLLWWLVSMCTAKHNTHGKGDDDGPWEIPSGVKRFTFKELMKATKSFSNNSEIGGGGFGRVYMGHLEDKKCVAIKRASKFSVQGTKEFRNEIILLSRLRHLHLVKLEGFCDDKGEQMLVYEYMSNGNLHQHLFDKSATNLNWYRRLEIALAVAQGLEYLHAFADPPVIHRDVKPSNILLDDKLVAKVSDFGISKTNPEFDTHVSTRPAGTAGYLDPEYFLRRQLTTASDVYGYGVVLLELLTGQLAIDHHRTEDYNLVGWVKTKLQKKEIHTIIDPRIGPDYPVEAYLETLKLGMQCTEYDRNNRPKMQTVVITLDNIISKLTPPPEHYSPIIQLNSANIIMESESKSEPSSTTSRSDIKTDFGFSEVIVEPR